MGEKFCYPYEFNKYPIKIYPKTFKGKYPIPQIMFLCFSDSVWNGNSYLQKQNVEFISTGWGIQVSWLPIYLNSVKMLTNTEKPDWNFLYFFYSHTKAFPWKDLFKPHIYNQEVWKAKEISAVLLEKDAHRTLLHLPSTYQLVL